MGLFKADPKQLLKKKEALIGLNRIQKSKKRTFCFPSMQMIHNFTFQLTLSKKTKTLLYNITQNIMVSLGCIIYGDLWQKTFINYFLLFCTYRKHKMYLCILYNVYCHCNVLFYVNNLWLMKEVPWKWDELNIIYFIINGYIFCIFSLTSFLFLFCIVLYAVRAMGKF